MSEDGAVNENFLIRKRDTVYWPLDHETRGYVGCTYLEFRARPVKYAPVAHAPLLVHLLRLRDIRSTGLLQTRTHQPSSTSVGSLDHKSLQRSSRGARWRAD